MNLNYKDVKEKYRIGLEYINNPEYIRVQELNKIEQDKTPYRYDIINFLLSTKKANTTYLEIGVRNPDDNFRKIKADKKYSVDPGVEFPENPVDFPVTSDEFFDKLAKGEILDKDIKFDLIFIDGLHLADQVWQDILNAEKFVKEDGFIVLHDCNPPSEWHTREKFLYDATPAYKHWNGTTWKAFYKYRREGSFSSCCIDTDWGLGIISKQVFLGDNSQIANVFYEYHVLDSNRKENLNLMSFEDLKRLF